CGGGGWGEGMGGRAGGAAWLFVGAVRVTRFVLLARVMRFVATARATRSATRRTAASAQAALWRRAPGFRVLAKRSYRAAARRVGAGLPAPISGRSAPRRRRAPSPSETQRVKRTRWTH